MKIKKHIIIAIVLSLYNSISKAQQDFVSAFGGVNICNIRISDQYIANKSNLVGLTGGFNYNYIFSNNIFVGSGLNYIEKGFKEPNIVSYELLVDKNGNVDYDAITKGTLIYNYKYLSIPLRAGYKIGNKLYATGSLGINSSFLIKSYTEYDLNGNKNNTIKSSNHLDLSVSIELGAGYDFNNRYSLFIMTGYNESFTSFSNGTNVSGNPKYYGYVMAIGLKYSLPK